MGAMSARPSSTSAGPQWSGLEVTPLLAADPAKVGDFWLDGRVHSRPSGTAWLGHGDGLRHHTRDAVTDPERRVILVQLAAGAAADKAARDRFSGLVNHLHIDDVVARGGDEQDQGRLGHRFRSEDDDPIDPDDAHPIAPWVALAFDDSPGAPATAERMLAEVDLLDLAPQGHPAGPDFRLHWIDRDGAGHNRIWPLPWPGRYDRAGWISILVSWLLMMALAALALLIAVLLFRNSEPQSPPPMIQTSPPPASASSSPGESSSASPSDSPSASPSGSSSGQPTPGPSGSAAGGTPTPPSRL
jgi:hypothetical protein